MTTTNQTFPLNDKGVPAALLLDIAGREIPFWMVEEGFEGLKGGMSFLLVTDPTLTDQPGFKGTYALVPREELSVDEWYSAAMTLTESGNNTGPIHCTFNTGQEFGYRNIVTGAAGVVPYANGKTIDSGKA